MEVMKYKGYGEFKAAMDKEVAGVAQGFVRMGYLLKVARDTDVLRESGYASVAEFAHVEYGLTKDIVSRYIAINDRFSEGGYSETLNLKYKDYGVAKLAEMLTLSDVVIDSLSPELTRKEIQDVKRDIVEENKITDLEVLMEEKEERQQYLEDNLSRVLYQYGYRNPNKYEKLHHAVTEVRDGGAPLIERILDVMAPTGIQMIRERIQGSGLFMLSIRGKDHDLELVNVRDNEKEVYTWDRLISSLGEFCAQDDAPVQPEKILIETSQTRMGTQKTAISQSEVEKEEKSEVKIAENPDLKLNEGQLSGQMNVDDYPELKPDEKQADYVTTTAAVQGDTTVQAEIVENIPKEIPKSGENVDFTLSEVDSESKEIDDSYRDEVLQYAVIIADNIKGWEKEVIPLRELDKDIEDTKEFLELLTNWRKERTNEETD